MLLPTSIGEESVEAEKNSSLTEKIEDLYIPTHIIFVC